MSQAELRAQLGEIHEEMPLWMDGFLERRNLSWRQLDREKVWGSDRLPFASLAELQQFIVLSDPVHFVECVFVERDVDGQPPWRLWDYQRAAMRYRGHIIFQCGAEVGKTRDIVGLAVWRAVTQRGDQLVGGALDGHINEIWREILGQCRLNPWLAAQVDWDATHVKPYKDLQFANGNIIHFRPAGVDGTAFRGIHVKLAAYLDEAVKVKSSEAWGNFESRCKPGAEKRYYSTPDGDRECPFFALAERTEEVPPLSPGAGRKGFIRLVWPKSLMPEPWWGPAREADKLEEYGSRESSEWQQNVEGRHGDPARSVFPWARFRRVVRHLPDYVSLQLAHDESSGSINVAAWRLDPTYELRAVGDEGEGETTSPIRRAWSDTTTFGELRGSTPAATVTHWVDYLRPILPAASGPYVIGIDPGSTTDPEEVLVAQPDGERIRLVCRIQLRHFSWDEQEHVLRAIHAIFRPSHGLGLDATGVGTALQHLLERHAEGLAWIDLDGYVMNARVEETDLETGQPVIDPATKLTRKLSLKELGTRLLEAAVQRATFEVPHDPDFLVQFPGHIATETPNGERRFSRTNDHLVDASRALFLRLHFLTHGKGTGPIEFASSGRTDSAGILELFS